MKGTVTATIKRKNGAIEKYEQENTVFDIPAIVRKIKVDNPELLLLLPVQEENIAPTPANMGLICLSEYELDTTKPSFVPHSLTIQSGSSSNWYSAPYTQSVSDKSWYRTATWTIKEALTLKSICLKSKDITSTYYATGSGSSDTIYGWFNDGLYYANANLLASKKLSFSDYKFTNNYNNGFSTNYKFPCSNTFSYYKLANENERFAILDAADNFRSIPYMMYSTDKLAICNCLDGSVIRKFKASQFTGYNVSSTSYYIKTRIINTGTKNYLLQATDVNWWNNMNVWEIPNEQIDETQQIPITKTISIDELSLCSIIGNFMLSNSACYQLKDDLTLVKCKGAMGNMSLEYYRSTYYQNKDYMLIRHVPTSSATSMGSVFPNTTALNFETPLEVAEGDVLTVMYNISIA